MNVMRFIYGFVFVTIFANFGAAQEIWSLDKCIQVAIDKSMQMQGSEISLRNAEIDYMQAVHTRYPNLSAGSSVGWNFGRTIDPTRNEFVTETFFNNSFSLNSNVTLFNGGRINNSIAQSSSNIKASQKDLEQTKRDISLSVASLYLNILFAKENLQNANNQLAQTKNQLELLNKQIAVGNRPENDRLDIEAQIATNEQTITESNNNLVINILRLKQWLRISPEALIDIVAPENLKYGSDPELITFDELFESAMRNQPSLHANELRIKSAMLSQKIAFANYLPSVGALANLRTNYSNKGVQIIGFTDDISYQDIIFNGTTQSIGFKQKIPDYQKSPYFDQFGDNLSYGVGVSLNVPIYNNLSARAGVQKAKLSTEQAQLNYDQTKETLKITVGQALADAKAAKSRMLATEKTKNAQTMVYNNALKKFDSGSLHVFELTRLKTLMDVASTNHLIAKYDYIFKTNVLDFYLGKPIQLTN